VSTVENATETLALLDLMIGPWRAKAVCAAAELGLPDLLSDRPMTSQEIAGAIGAHAPSVHRVLRLLAGSGLVSGDDAAGFRLTERGALLRQDVPGSMRDLAVYYGNVIYRAFDGLTDSVRTGDLAFERIYGAPFFPYLEANPGMARLFDGAMAAGSAFLADVPRVYDFSAARTAVDLGGGKGQLLAGVLRAYPRLRGVLFDAEHVIEAARPGLASFGSRCELVSGDFFLTVPDCGDVYLLARILHDWEDEDCLRILRLVRSALGPGGTLLVIERLVPEDGGAALALEWDVHMMLVTGGRERTESEFRSLFSAAGLTLAGRLALPLGADVLVVRPQ
jgi:O-methyltransferase domain